MGLKSVVGLKLKTSILRFRKQELSYNPWQRYDRGVGFKPKTY